MIPLKEAYDLVINAAPILPTEKININKGLGRVLAEDVKSDIDVPSFNRVTMDGYACKRKDLSQQLEIVETIMAGQVAQKKIENGQCTKIMTGAPLPEGADCVFMVEYSENPSENTVRFTGEKTKNNISPIGELIKKEEVVLNKGALIDPQHIAVLATVGHINPIVYQQPRVGIIATGDELVEPNEKPGPSQLRNSNSLQLYTQVINTGGIPTNYGIAKDNEKSITDTIEKALAENDLILLSGGVSMGELDLVKVVLQKKFEIFFDALFIKPGKPTVFAKQGQKLCFGLPGNPVSSFAVFELLVRPLLFQMMGHRYQPIEIKMPLGEDYHIKNPNRQKWVPVVLENGFVTPLVYKGSAHSNSLINADGIMPVTAGLKIVTKGTLVDVRPI